MIFFSKLSFQQCKDYLFTNIKNLDACVISETTQSVEYQISKSKRQITIKLTYVSGKVTIDVSDNFYLMHVPRLTFKKFDKYKSAINSLVGSIYDEFQLGYNSQS